MGSVICFFISIQKLLPISFRHIRYDIKKFQTQQLNTPFVCPTAGADFGVARSQATYLDSSVVASFDKSSG